MKINKIIIILLAISFLNIFSFITINNVKASTTYTISFEDGVLNTPYSGAKMISTKYFGDEFEVDNVYAPVGTKTFHVHNSEGWFNLSDGNYLTGFQCVVFGQATDLYMEFFSSVQYARGDITVGTEDTNCIIFLDNEYGYCDHNGVSQTIWPFSTSSWCPLTFSINDVDSVSYSYNNHTVPGTPCNVSALTGGYKIDRIFIRSYTHTHEFDNIELTYSTSNYSGGGGETPPSNPDLQTQCFMLDKYDSCSKNYYPYQYIGVEYRQVMNIVINKFEIHVLTNKVLDLTKFTLRDKNLVSYGYPDNYILYRTCGSYNDYILQWNNLSITCMNEKPTFFIRNTGYLNTGNSYYWITPFTYYSDNHDTNTYFGIANWNFNVNSNNDLEHIDPESPYRTLPFCFYYTISYIPTTPPYTFDLITVPDGTLYTNTSIKIAYFVKTIAEQNTLKIYKNGIEIYSKNIYDYSGLLDYVFTNDGTYKLGINRTGSGEVVYTNINVINILYDSWVYCVPEPSTTNSQYNIYYKYNSDSGYDGAIYSYEYDIRYYQIGRYSVIPVLLCVIPPNTTGTISHIGTVTGVNYLVIATHINYSTELFSYIHYIMGDNQPESISVSHSTLNLIDGKATQSVRWSHFHFGYTVKIYDNDNFVYDCGNTLSGSTNYDVTSIGYHNVSLSIITHEGAISIATTSYTVTGTETPPIIPTPPNVFDFSTLPTFIKIICALIIIITLTITPLILSFLLSKGRIEINIPSLVYVAFFFIGIVASVMMGFLDLWVIMVVFMGLLLTIVILWIQKKNTSGV